MQQSIKAHVRPNRSRLEEWREEIIKMRRLEWPYDNIVNWLIINKQFKVSREAVRKFCRVRGIQKGQVNRRPAPQPTISKPRKPSKQKQVFEYDDSKPINVNR